MEGLNDSRVGEIVIDSSVIEQGNWLVEISLEEL